MISDLRRQARKRRRVCTNACYRTLAPRGPLRARPPHRHPSTSHGSPISQLACGRWLEVELDAKVAVVAQQVRREQRPRVEQQADPLRHDLPRATSGHLGYISSSRSAARHNLDPKGGQPDRVGRRVVRVDRASLHMQGTGAAGDGPTGRRGVGGASEASRRRLGSVSEVSRKCPSPTAVGTPSMYAGSVDQPVRSMER